MELLESLVTHLTAAVVGAAIVWYPNRTIKRQFRAMMESIDAGKERGKDWRFVRNDAGEPVGFRVIVGASAATDDPKAV